MSIFIAPFLANDFMSYALIAGICVSITCGVVGTFMVLRSLAFMGDALAHGALPGIAVALLLGLPGIIGAIAGATAMVLTVGIIVRTTKLSSDTAIGLLFVSMLALGVVIISRSGSFSGDIVRILFGEILGTGPAEIVMQGVTAIIIIAAAILFRRPFLLLCLGNEHAELAGFKGRVYHNILLFMIALTVIMSFRTVGTLLVFGMLLAPASTAALATRRLSTMIVCASIIGSVSVYCGLLVSYHFSTAAGASIVIFAAAIFFAFLIASQVRKRIVEAHGAMLPK